MSVNIEERILYLNLYIVDFISANYGVDFLLNSMDFINIISIIYII